MSFYAKVVLVKKIYEEYFVEMNEDMSVLEECFDMPTDGEYRFGYFMEFYQHQMETPNRTVDPDVYDLDETQVTWLVDANGDAS